MQAFAILAAVLLSMGALQASGQAAPGLVQVTADEIWRNETRRIVGDLIIEAPATLRLEGVTLEVGQRILVAQGAKLELAPHEGRPTVLSGFLDSPASETHGLWIDVAGTLLSGGEPRTEIRGLRGSGLNSLFVPGGGIYVRGTATLADILVHSSNGTLNVPAGGSLALEHAEVRDMGFMALGVFGTLVVRNSTVDGSAAYGIMGRSTCDMTIAHSRILGRAQAILVNGCHLQASDSEIIGATTGIYAPGGARVNLERVDVTGFRTTGVSTKALPRAGGGALENGAVVIAGSRIASDPEHPGGAVGLNLVGAVAAVTDTRFVGGLHAIAVREDAFLTMVNVSAAGYGFSAVDVRFGRVVGDLLAGNQLGPGEPSSVPVTGLARATASVRSSANNYLSGPVLQVRAADGALLGQSPANTTSMYAEATYAPYGWLDSRFVYRGPFSYTIIHPELAVPLSGVLDASRAGFMVQAPPPAPASGDAGERAWWLAAVLVAAAGTVAYARMATRGRKGKPGR